jgi:hypothetical protein
VCHAIQEKLLRAKSVAQRNKQTVMDFVEDVRALLQTDSMYMLKSSIEVRMLNSGISSTYIRLACFATDQL